ncbi:CheB methylesterase domain-containing protein [Garciella nitratireducens]|uniref:protein-glutamate methylesterase n=1 Tax=Garciella nitratireducens DSM 15102 TaxID=1121911 RepID=A0A1T4LFW9_9FIRM|nr:CheB methylesterase domain-containing protein [Garciella nitratireducens]RBP46789.1 two-component system chemotaxis response regulator CheB [Garciella nitratireducens]SJZ53615.1 two-component system, chemotaxis family, response regulator CheB [Garciella nitratireducens DSM 15102]
MSNLLLPLLDRKWSAIAIGASTGGPKTLTKIIANLPENTQAPPIFIVQHMPKGFTTAFAQRLDDICSLKVVEAKNGEVIKKGHIYIAPGDFHMTIQKQEIVQEIVLDQREKHLGVRPSVDYLFSSAAKIYKEKLLSIILTGMGKDGTEGMKDTKKYGGVNIAQDQKSAIIFGMPGSAIESGVVDKVLSLEDIMIQLKELLKR